MVSGKVRRLSFTHPLILAPRPRGRGTGGGSGEASTRPTGPLADRVRDVLDTQVNPAIAAHGGEISLVDVQSTEIFLEMSGDCQGVERMLRQAVPELTAVHDVTDHASGQNPYFNSDS